MAELATYTLRHGKTGRRVIVNQQDYHENLGAYSEFDRVGESNPEPVIAAADGESDSQEPSRTEDIIDLLRAGTLPEDAYAKDGKPRVDALSAALGRRVSADERDAALATLNVGETDADGDEGDDAETGE